ncbi:DNA-deoxyinosine glycosylase [Marinobacterium sediminicola]|uniref:G/U mismatch-specific uracil-DNA glycosylase n=1 Tax=Marinobacterium sediminicola TaxID=518898 RepID=A0ABY1RYC8_9GAMM|nr:DNA-deoxyinosine glycosylase [Marinobacterium sediminicola]ULG68708.1 DNA-deoxyinosine glycosylase [Marinobacterium sediminicola]SMR73233.1 G/U mismatch-specific uracil-DNA glycosylase [Marinobacterium sediminicola]
MNLSQSFEPVWHPKCRVLVLGSSPGLASLKAQSYYAHPRNAFWPIMARLCGFESGLSYCARLEFLKVAGVALWDVAQLCERQGSLDANIRQQSVEPNDIEWLAGQMPDLQLIAFNGGAAEQLYKRHFKSPPPLQFKLMPSTSPAHASLSLEQKYEYWSELQKYLRVPG